MTSHSYRLYVLTADGHIGRRCDLVNIESDEEAFREAKMLSLSTECEIWDLGRLVGRVPVSSDRCSPQFDNNDHLANASAA
jgi:hypothetical protein